ncbi:MAG: hypothetical protein QM784_18890 [Polyangiaceae bacterium]
MNDQLLRLQHAVLRGVLLPFALVVWSAVVVMGVREGHRGPLDCLETRDCFLD